MSTLPAHASPAFPPRARSPPPAHDDGHSTPSHFDLDLDGTPAPRTAKAPAPYPPPLVTPSLSPNNATASPYRPPRTADADGPAAATLLEDLPRVECVVRARIPTTAGQEMFLHLYQNDHDNKEHLAIVFGPHIRSSSLDAPRPGESEMDRMIRGAYTGRLYPGRTSSQKPATPGATTSPAPQPAHAAPAAPRDPPLVRIHSECYTGETVWSARCDCGEQLDEAARLMAAPAAGAAPSPGGVIVYLRQEGRGIGLSEKLKAYNLQDLGSDTVEANLLLRHPADARSYGLATAMLLDLGLGGARGIRLLTNNPDKVRAVEGRAREVRVVERVEMVPLAWQSGGKVGVQGDEIGNYLRTKIERMGHMLSQK